MVGSCSLSTFDRKRAGRVAMSAGQEGSEGRVVFLEEFSSKEKFVHATIYRPLEYLLRNYTLNKEDLSQYFCFVFFFLFFLFIFCFLLCISFHVFFFLQPFHMDGGNWCFYRNSCWFLCAKYHD